MISVDAYLNQTTRHAHVILPATSALEQPYFDIWSWTFALRSGSKYADPLFASADGWVPEWQVLLRLGALCAGKRNDEIDIDQLDTDFFSVLCSGAGLEAATIVEQAPEPGPERICDLAVRAGPWGDRYGEQPGGLTLEDIRSAPNGIDLGPVGPRIREILRTESGRIELAPPYITADIPRLEALFDRTQPELVLVSRRHLRSLNSWMHNVEVLMKGKDRSGLHIHPDDAARAGVADGGTATVTSSAGSVIVAVEITDDISPGVVSLPHGWGHDVDGARLNVARRYPGVTSNLLSPGDLLDVISGNAVLNGIPVTVEAGPVHHDAPVVRHADHPIDALERPGEPELYGNAGFAG
jgi:anaerobic selenocysteine-containing dehydrogenase